MTFLSLFLQADTGGQTGGGMNIMTLIMMGGIFVVFWLFFIRPQQKKQKEERNFRENLAKGDKVMTIGGIHGKITSVEDFSVLLEVDEGVKLRVDKGFIRAAPQSRADNGDRDKGAPAANR